MLKGKQKNLDLNKNGKLDAEDFKMLRGEKMKTGGEVEEKMKRGGKAKRSKHAIIVDSEMKAKKPGKRISDAGNVYYEYRTEHSDESRKKKPYLEDGGIMAEGGEVKNEMKETKETNWVYSIGGL